MKLFDSLTHVTRDGSWMGERLYDASLTRLLREMDAGRAYRACLVSIADYVDNEVIIESARAYPDRFVPIAGLNPRVLPTTRRIEAVLKQLRPRALPASSSIRGSTATTRWMRSASLPSTPPGSRGW